MPFLSELRYAARSLTRSPALTVALLATVAVGMGTYATVRGLIDGLVQTTVSVPDAERLVGVYAREPDGRYRGLSRDELATVRAATGAFDAVAGFSESRVRVSVGERSAWMPAATVTPGFWTLMGVSAALGAAPDVDGSDSVVISDRLWRDQFGARTSALGTEIRAGGRPRRIAAVLPEWFQGIYLGRAVDVWMMQPVGPGSDAGAAIWTFARLHRGLRIDGAQRLLPSPADGGPGWSVVPFTGVEPEIQIKFARMRQLLVWAAALVLVTAGANVAGFLLSRATRRAPETAARIALGATPGHLAARIGAESLVISAAGTALGALVAYWTATAAPAFFYAEDAARLRTASPWHGLAGAAACTAIMLLCGLAPLAGIRRHGTLAVLRQSESAGATQIGVVRTVLVVAQMGICVVLVIGTALLAGAFRAALKTARADSLGQPLVATLVAAAGYGDEAAGADYFRRVEAEVSGALGVTAVAWSSTPPGARSSEIAVRLEPPPARTDRIALRAMVPRGRELLALKVREGRHFGGTDGPLSCTAALVTEDALRNVFGGRAVGRMIEDASGQRIDIVGVVARTPAAGRDAGAGAEILFFERQMPARFEAGTRQFRLPVLPNTPPAVETEIEALVVSAGYFAAIGAPLTSGSGFDSDTTGCGTAIVNREADAAYFGGRAVGGAVIDADGRRSRIAGVVDDGALRVLQRRRAAAVYFPMPQHYTPRATLIAGASAAPAALLADVAKRINLTSGGARRAAVVTLDEHLARTSLGPERIGAALVAASASVALGLAILGAYGVMADAVRQRKREIALRLALGSPSWRITAGVLRDGARLAVAGAAAGLTASWLLVRVVTHANPAFAAPAPWMWMLSPVALFAVVALAAVLPARWALAIDPLTITREH